MFHEEEQLLVKYFEALKETTQMSCNAFFLCEIEGVNNKVDYLKKG